MDNDVQAKVDQEETDKIDQSEQEKAAKNTEAEDNAVKAEVDGGRVKGDGNVNGDLWELEDINEMQMERTEFLGGNNYNNNVSGGWGEWKHEGEETWREWEFYPSYHHHQENDWVIDDLWVFEDRHFPDLVNDGDDAANPRHPPQA